MNHQDKPLEVNDNWEQQDINLSNNNNQTEGSRELNDLWTNEGKLTSIDNINLSLPENLDSDDAPLDLLTEVDELEANQPSPEEFELQLSEWDFRNPPGTASAEAANVIPTEPNLLDSELDLDSLESEARLTLENSEINLTQEMDLAELIDLDVFKEVNAPKNMGVELQSFSEIDTELLSSSGGLSELESLIAEPTDNDSLDNLENMLEESANSLELEANTDFITLENSLESNLGLSALDDILDTPQPPTASEPELSTASSSKPYSKTSNPSPAPQAKGFEQTMRVSVRKLDDLNNLIGELVVKRNRLEEDQERLRRFLDNLFTHVQSLGDAGARMHDMYERSLLEGALMASRQSRSSSPSNPVRSGFLDNENKQQDEGLDALEMDRFTGFHLLSQEIIELIVRVREAASDIQFVVDESDQVTQTFRQVTSQLQERMNSSRMVAFGQTADRLPRAVRDISRKLKKQAQLNVEGKDVLIDKMIVEHLYNPMTHLVNNAISHGIELPEQRIKLGKPATGQINIRAFIQGNQTVITVSDDGAGINPEIVKSKAIEKKLITWATAQNLTQQEVYELLFHPGFSTKDRADDFAGRGVGMDVVSTDLKKIRGVIGIESELGKGTTFTIRLPLVLSICKALTCIDNNNYIAFPIDGIEDTKEYLPSEIKTNANGVKCISWQDKLLPLRPLSSLFSYNRQIRRAGIYNANRDGRDDTISVIILRSVDHLLAVEVEQVQAEQEIVIKQIDGPVSKPPGIAGATVLGDGQIMPIGDVLELIEIAQGKRTIELGANVVGDLTGQQQPQMEIRSEPMVLVVDDSITVRELLSLSFNKLGYRVEQARDGQEAWDKLRGGLPCDMIFCDIEMPRMNGLELLSNLQKHEDLKLIPVAMLTSRGAEKHRKLARDLGAKAYLTKPYTEKDLMDVAQRLIEVNRTNQEAESFARKIQTAEQSSSSDNRHANAHGSDNPLVLIIDDSVTVRELLSMTFKKAGYRVEQARDGQEAWDKLKEGLDCDLAFCDIEMPRMNGLELLSQLQKDEQLSALPIAMLTSRGAQKMRNIAAKRGAKGYFVKPYVEDVLLDAAKRMLEGEIVIEAE